VKKVQKAGASVSFFSRPKVFSSCLWNH